MSLEVEVEVADGKELPVLKCGNAEHLRGVTPDSTRSAAMCGVYPTL